MNKLLKLLKEKWAAIALFTNRLIAKVKVITKAAAYTAYGLSALVSLTYATLNALNKPVSLTTNQRYFVIACICITAAPVLNKLGEIIIKGIIGMAKEVKE